MSDFQTPEMITLKEKPFDKLFQKLSKKLEQIDAKLSRINEFSEAFHGFHQRVSSLFEQGGEIELEGRKIKFEKCENMDHNMHHIDTVIEMAIKLLPGFIKQQKESGNLYSEEDIENLLLAALLHDTGWLRNSEDEKDLFSWSGEKFFVHAAQSEKLAEFFLKSFGITDERRIKQIQKLIKATEFNKLKAETEEKPSPLGNVLSAADNLSYFCDENDIPERVQRLYHEAQATVKITQSEEDRTLSYILEQIEKTFGQIGENAEAKKQFNIIKAKIASGELTIADIKFPTTARHAGLFVGSDYLSLMYERYQEELAHLKLWGENPEETSQEEMFFLTNIARSKSIQELMQKPGKNPLCFFEASLTKQDLLQTALKFGIKISQTGEDADEKQEWEKIDLKLLGVSETNLFNRLATSEIRILLENTPPEKRREVLATLLGKVAEKGQHHDEIIVSIAPQEYGELLTNEDIAFAFDIANAARPSEAKIIPAETIRRDRKDWVMREFGKIAPTVVFAGVENEDLNNFISIINKLADNPRVKEIILQAGQTLESGGNSELAAQNLKTAIELAKQSPKIKIIGPMANRDEFLEDLQQLSKEGRLLTMPTVDIESRLFSKAKDLPALSLATKEIYPQIAALNQQLRSTIVVDAVLLASKLVSSPEKPKTKEEKEKYIQEVKKQIITLAQKFLSTQTS